MATDTSSKKITATSSFESFLLDHGFLTKVSLERLQKARDTNSQSPGAGSKDIEQLLLAEKLMNEEDLAQAKAAFLNLPYVDLRKVQVQPKVLAMIPEESRNFYKIMPFDLVKTTLKVAVTDPGNLQALEALEFLGQKQNLQIQIYLASSTSINSTIGKKQNIGNVVGEALKNIEQQQLVRTPGTDKAENKSQVIEDAPIIKIVDVILTNAIEGGASDIHIEPSENDVRVRYRIDGILHSSLRLPKNVNSAIISRIKILANLKIDEQRIPQDGRFHMDLGNRSVDFRVSTLPLMYGEKVVMRLLDKTSSVPTLDQLGVRGKAKTWVLDNIKKPHGIFLITGPTGSGKSTTLYAILSMLNTAGVNIVTLEDPVEYFIEGVNQSQINPDVGLTFASGLRSILRQDPNIIMVGEIRDQETAELAVHAALTGHLVFSTLHTNNAVGAIPRMMNMDIESFLLSASLNLIMAQRLVRKLCEDCKVPVEPTAIIKKEIEKELIGVPEEYLTGIDPKKYKVYNPKGCDRCGQSGYKGRLGIYEILPILQELQELAFSQEPAYKVYEAALKFGVISMKQDGVVKVLNGETTMEEILRVTSE